MASPERISQINDLRYRWEVLVGHSVAIPEWAVQEMADDRAGIESLYDFGQYVARHVGDMGRGDMFIDPGAWASMPWAQWGMNNTDYHEKLTSFDTAFRILTGQAAPQDLVDQALHEHQGRMSEREFSTWLQAQDSVKQTYGWLRFGLDFNQFQERKLSMRTAFGRELSDAEAVTQLQYHHAAQGQNVAVRAQQEQGQQQRRQAEVGISGSVVR